MEFIQINNILLGFLLNNKVYKKIKVRISSVLATLFTNGASNILENLGLQKYLKTHILSLKIN